MVLPMNEADKLEAQARELEADAEHRRRYANVLRQQTDEMDGWSFAMAERIRPDVWQGRAAQERESEAGERRDEARQLILELEDIADELEGEAARLEQQADDLRYEARVTRWAVDAAS
jgi:uncharacterized protein YukE